MKRLPILVLLATCCTAQPAPGRDPIAEAFERGYWAGWRQHAIVVGGGL